ncbi:MAG: YIP1 family protein [Ignavibacteria bacterium]|nr:YIP1 family protein [Ignavibacteria bacterium]
MSEETYDLQENHNGNSVQQLSVGEAISGVFTEPSETFETIASTPRKNYWLIPVLISIALSLAATFLFMRDTELVDSVMDKQKVKLSEQFDKNVKEGKMSREDADKALEGISSKSTFFMLAGYGGAVLGPFIILFLLSIIYLVVLKIAKAEFDFGNVLNVVGLSAIIASLGGLLSMVVSIFTGRVSGIGLGLLFKEENIGVQMYAILSKIDIFQIWFYVVVAIGLSKIARISMATSAAIVFGIYIVYIIASSFLA